MKFFLIVNKFIRSHTHALILLVLAGVSVVSSFIWLCIDTRPPAWDQSTHFLLALDYLHAIRSGSFWNVLTVSHFYPPLYHLSLIPSIYFFQSVDAAVMTNVVYLMLCVYALYGIGATVCKPSVGLLSACLFFLFPFVQMISRECMIDVALIAWVCLSFYFLIKTRYFYSPGYTWLFVFSSAAGMLTKWNFIFYLCIPFVLYYLKARVDRKRKALLALCGIMLLCLPWYGANMIFIIQKGIRYILIGGVEGDPRIFTFSSLFWYPLSLGYQLYQPVAALSIITVCIMCLKPQKEKWILLTWILVPLIIHTIISNKDMRYSLPVLPALAVVIAVWLLRDGQKKMIKSIWVISVISILFVQTLHASYHMPFLPRRVAFAVSGKQQMFLDGETFIAKHEDWKHAELYDAFKQCVPAESDIVRVTIVSNHPYMHGASLRCFGHLYNLPYETVGYKNRLGELSPLIIYKTGDRGPAFSLGEINKAAARIENPSDSFHHFFKICASIDLPDGSQSRVYRLREQKKENQSKQDIIFTVNELQYKRFDAKKVSIRVAAQSLQHMQQGMCDVLNINVSALRYSGLELNDLSLNLKHIMFDQKLLLEQGELFMFDLENIELSLRLKAENLKNYLISKNQHIKNVSIIMDNDVVRITGRMYGIPVAATVRITIDRTKRLIGTAISAVRIMHIPIPQLFFAALTNRMFSLSKGRDLPFTIALNQIIITDGSLIVQ